MKILMIHDYSGSATKAQVDKICKEMEKYWAKSIAITESVKIWTTRK